MDNSILHKIVGTDTKSITTVNFHKKGLRGPEKHSPIWKFFIIAEEGGEKYSKCLNCSYKNKGRNTTNLKHHLKKHSNLYNEYCKLKSENTTVIVVPSIPSLTPPSPIPVPALVRYVHTAKPIKPLVAHARNRKKEWSLSYGDSDPKYQEIKKRLTYMGACSDDSLTVIESPEFREFIASIDIKVERMLPTQNTMKNWINSMMRDLKLIVKENIKKAGKFSIISDICNPPSINLSYLGVTACYYSIEENKVETVALACRPMKSPVSPENVNAVLNSVIDDWNLQKTDVLVYLTGQNTFKHHLEPVLQSNFENESYTEFSQLKCITDLALSACQTALDQNPHFYTQNENANAQLDENGIMFDTVNPFFDLRNNVLPFIKQISETGRIAWLRSISKDLYVSAENNWKEFYYIVNELHSAKTEFQKFCDETKIEIPFSWEDVENCTKLFGLFADFNENMKDNGCASSEVVPEFLSLGDHLDNDFGVKYGKFEILLDPLTSQLHNKTGSFFFPGDKLNPIFLICSMLDPEKSAELNDFVFGVGKTEFKKFFLESSITEEIVDTTLAKEKQFNVVPETSKRRRLTSNPDEVTRNDVLLDLKYQVNDYVYNILTNGDFQTGINPFEFWKNAEHTSKYNKLANAARNMLCIPTTSVSVQTLFSTVDFTMDLRRKKISHNQLETKMLFRFNKKLM